MEKVRIIKWKLEELGVKKQQSVKDNDWKPSPHALKSCSETSFKEGKCLWCRGSDINDDVDMSLDSLRKRTNAEMNEAKPFFEKNLSKKKQRVFKQFLKQNKIPVGPGCGRRLGRQSTITKAGIQAQLFRTLHRIQFEISLKDQAIILSEGLLALGAL